MEYEQRSDDTSGTIATGLREHFPVSENEDGKRTFEVPDGLGAETHQRLVDAGHQPLEPESLLSGVTNNGGASEESESASESEETTEPTNDPSEGDGGEEQSEATEENLSADDLDAMNRSELYSFANEEIGLSLAWSGEEALNEEEMRARIKQER